MVNLIVVNEEELVELLLPPHKDRWYRDMYEAGWKERIAQGKEPTLLGYSEDGLAVYELQFTL